MGGHGPATLPEEEEESAYGEAARARHGQVSSGV